MRTTVILIFLLVIGVISWLFYNRGDSIQMLEPTQASNAVLFNDNTEVVGSDSSHKVATFDKDQLLNESSHANSSVDEHAMSNILTPEMVSTIDSIAESLRPDNYDSWDDFMNMADTKAGNVPPLYSVYLAQAIRQDAPDEVLFKLMQRGAEFSGDHLALLILKKNLASIELLENMGLDIFQQSSDGRNALVHSLFSKDVDSKFKYFLRRNIPVNSDDTDILMAVLEVSERLRLGSKYAELLIDKGAIAKEPHLSKLNYIKGN